MTESAFPDVRWGSETSVLRRPAAAFAATRPGSWVLRNLSGLDRRVLERSRGRLTVLGPIGAPVVLLTTTGRKSGQPRISPLLYVREDDRIFVAGSNFGGERHPGWTANLRADPHATVTIGGRDLPVRATELKGEERERIYAEFMEMVRVYDVYRGRTDREIRVFALARSDPRG
ncbi:nitroreductase/quinone reductase family protein [Speluncibacter jeojiensis]|uniref:Nitroreductase family deazaflavin-dependent oxidoreductase n=1 Tax=Speluncibacter jeojiensis TaxID=2710754 RepID=A0A9X4M642_9ACTN|nr:nitroreductase family deazaflavin-dependent oxidoreductase [Corynebacteriales bacterium D3-21]